MAAVCCQKLEVGCIGRKIHEHELIKELHDVVAQGCTAITLVTAKWPVTRKRLIYKADIIILHAADTTACDDATNICSPETDVLVLVVRRYPVLCRNTNFIT